MMVLGDENVLVLVVAHHLHEEATAALLRDIARHVVDLRQDLARGLLRGVDRNRTCVMTGANIAHKTRDHRDREEITIERAIVPHIACHAGYDTCLGRLLKVVSSHAMSLSHYYQTT